MSGARMRGFPAGDGEARGIIASWQRMLAGTFQWHRPPVDQPNLTWIEILCWAAGGGGAVHFAGGTNANASGGEGGTCIRYVLPYTRCPAAIDFQLGAGGQGSSYSANNSAVGTDGGDSQFTIGDLTFIAQGGAGGILTANTQPTPLTDCTINGISVASYAPFFGGNGGKANNTTADAGDFAVFGGAGGGAAAHDTSAAVSGLGGSSMNGGAGGAGAGSVAASAATAGNGVSPGGGGGGAVGKIGGNAATSGNGADGGVIVNVLSYRPDGPLGIF